MTEEEFSVVDEDDKVIGKVTKSEYRKDHLKYIIRVVHVLVFNSEGRLFLQKRSMNKSSGPGKMTSSACGRSSYGETYEESALRELEEEIGIEGVHLQEFGFLKRYNDKRRVHYKIYKTLYDGKMKFKPDEVEDGRFFTIKEIEKMIKNDPEQFQSSFIEIFNKFVKNGTDKRTVL